MTDTGNHPEALYVGTCTCGQPVYRRTRSGAPPKRCETCREESSSKNEHDGPVIQIRRLLKHARRDIESKHGGGVLKADAIIIECAGVAVSKATGIESDMAQSIVATLRALFEDGESGLQIRTRLNPNPAGFAERPAGVRTPRGRSSHEILSEALNLAE